MYDSAEWEEDHRLGNVTKQSKTKKQQSKKAHSCILNISNSCYMFFSVTGNGWMALY